MGGYGGDPQAQQQGIVGVPLRICQSGRKKSAAEAAKELGIAEADIKETEELPDAVHIFSHVEWHMCGRRIRLKRASGYQDKTILMVRRAELQDRYPIPNAFRVYTNILI